MSLHAGAAAVHAARPRVAPVQLVAILYALWLLGLTVVTTRVTSLMAIEIALLAGIVPAVAQSLLLPADTRGSGPGMWFLWAFVTLVLASYLVNGPAWEDLVSVFNVLLVFMVGVIVASAADQSLVARIAATYAVVTTVYLLHVNLYGTYVWGRLTAGASPNLWGLISLNVAAGALCLKSRVLAGWCWAIVLMTMYNAQTRGSMLALVPLVVAAAYHLLFYQRQIHASWKVVVVVLALIGGLVGLAARPGFLIDDIMRLNDPYRGKQSGATNRDVAVGEAIKAWTDRPLLGVGYRKHEQYMIFTSIGSSHNAYVAMLADTGFVGFVLYVGFLGCSLVAARQGIADHKLRLFAVGVIVSYALVGLFERRAINAGNAYSITFIFVCLFSLRLARFPAVARPRRLPMDLVEPYRPSAAGETSAGPSAAPVEDPEARTDRARDMIETYLDVDAIALAGLGRHRVTITKAEWREYRGLLRDLIVYGYALHFSDLSPDNLEVIKVVKHGSRRATVHSQVRRPDDGRLVAVDWRIRTASTAGDAGFKVTDVVIEGTSAARTLRADVSAIIASDGISRVCAVLRGQVNAMRGALG